MFSEITNIYNKKTKRPTLMELFTDTGKLKKFFWQLEMFDVCTTGDTVHINKIFKFLPHTRQYGCIDIFHCRNDPCLKVRINEKKLFQFSCGREQSHYGRSFGFLVIHICNHGEHYETRCIQTACVTILLGNPLIENVDFIESKPIQALWPVCWHLPSTKILRKEGPT
jgi:hypothetical protein